MKFQHASLSAVLIATLVGCGGGGGDGGSAAVLGASGAVTYTASASAGELITYTLDTSALTYSYEITESAWGLKGQTGSGTLIRNSDGTYTPSEASNTRLVVGDGVVIGAVRKVVGASSYTFPFIGTSGLVASTAELAGTYNYLHRVCSTVSSCNSYYGTIKVDATGNWSSCRSGNLAAITPGCSVTASGTVTALGNGRFQLNGTSAQMWGVKVGTSKLVVVDYYTANAGESLVATEQAAYSSGSGNGNWFVISPTARVAAKMTITGNNTLVKSGDVISFGGPTPPTDVTNAFTGNSPWTGMGATSNGIGMVSGNTAFYGFTVPTSGYFEFGIKTQ
jgi:hypothetical protein